MLLVPAYLAKQKNRVQYQPGNYQREKNDAEYEQDDLAQIQQDPRYVERNGQSRQANAENEKKDSCLTPTHV